MHVGGRGITSIGGGAVCVIRSPPLPFPTAPRNTEAEPGLMATEQVADLTALILVQLFVMLHTLLTF